MLKSNLKAYAFFLAFTVVTAVAVKPLLKQFGVPGADKL